MKRFLKILIALLLLISTASWCLSHSSWGQKKLKFYAEKALSNLLGAKVKVGSVDLIFPLYINIQDIDLTKQEAFIHIDSASCIPFWLDLPFKRITLFSATLEGIEIGKNSPEKFLTFADASAYSLSAIHFHLKSVHIANDKIPGHEFDGSLKGRFYISSSSNIIKLNATATRSLPTAWPRCVKVRFSKQNNLYQTSGSLCLEGMSSFPFFGENDKISWDLTSEKKGSSFQALHGSWNISCPTTEIPLMNNFVVNRKVEAQGTIHIDDKSLTFSCDDLDASMIFGKNFRVQTDAEGAGATLMQYGEPLKFHAKMSLESLASEENKAVIRFLAPSFSCNSYTGTLQGTLNCLKEKDSLSISSTADGVLLSEQVEAPIHFLSNLKLESARVDFSSDLLVSPFHLSNKFEINQSTSSTWVLFRCQDLGVLQKYIPLTLGGSGEISFTSKESENDRQMNLSSHFSNASIGSFSCTSADMNVSSQNLLEKIILSLDLTSGKLGGVSLDKAQASCSINPKTLDLQLSDLRLIGKAAALPFDLTGAGDGKVDSIQSYVNLTSLNGSLLNEKIFLDRPIRVESIDIEELFSQAIFSLRVGDQGTLNGHWIHPSPSRCTLELAWRDVPFPIMAALTGILSASGLMTGECHYQTTPRDAVGSFQMEAQVSRCGALGSPEGSLEIGAALTLADSELKGDLTVNGTGILEPIRSTFSLPIKRLAKTPFINVSKTLPMKAHVKGKGQVSKLFHYWMPQEIGCEAILACDSEVSGSLEDLNFSGPICLHEGQMELLATGQTLETIEMNGQMHHRTLSITSIKAKDTGEGTLTGNGIINFFEEGVFSWKVFLKCKDLEVVNLPYTNAVADGDIELHGTQGALLISGHATAQKAFVDVAARFPTNIPELCVTFCGEEKQDKPPYLVTFDLYLDGPAGEIRGRGLRTDWKGHAHLSGPASQLSIYGLVECTKGTFTLAGKELSMSQGTISVAGNLFKDSALNVLANVSLPSISVQVGLKGSLKEPKFFIQSTPILPEKEILSLLLFNKEYGDISPLESLQLANAAMSLQEASGPFDLIDHVKSTLGIDLIDIGSSDITPGQVPPWSTLGADNEEQETPFTTPQNDVTLKVGKYISDGVAVTVSKDVTAGVNRVGLEASLSQHVTAQAEIGDDAGGIASLKWKKDY